MLTGDLPRSRTPFFGRHGDLRRIEELLGEHRLVTLTGVGGAGKSRLALRVAENAVPGLADDVGWVELASLDDDGLVASAACSRLGVRVQSGRAPVDALSARYKDDRVLLVIDNCEHLLEGCAELVTDLLDRCPRIRLLTTSRSPLRVEGERLWPLAGLSLPSPDGNSVPDARDAESVQLFVARVRSNRPGFEIDQENLESVVGLCRRLEGIPLAIELAAARARMLAPGQIARRLDDGLRILSQTGRGLPARHRTMRAALAWSHELLEEPERVLFRRLGIFGGDVRVEDIESVCATAPLDRDAVLDLLDRLVDWSLVTAEDSGRGTRCRLLEPVRRFAIECLEQSGEAEDLRSRHMDHFVQFAEAMAPGLQGPGRADSLERLDARHDDLRRAWDHAESTERGDVLGRLVRALFWFWHFGGHFDEGRRRSDTALARLPSDEEGRANLLWASGALAWMQADYEVARSRLEQCALLCRESRLDGLLGSVLRELAGVRLALGDLRRASKLYEESAALLAASERSWDEALAQVMRADVRLALGDARGAAELRERARRLFAEEGDPWGLSLAHLGLGHEAARQNDHVSARHHAREALSLQTTGGDVWNVGQILLLLGEIELQDGGKERAAALLIESIEALRRVGDRVSLSQAILCLSRCEAARGRTLRAIRLAGAGRGIGEPLEARYPYALSTDADHDRNVDELRDATAEDAFAHEWAAGRAMSLDEAVACALDDPERGAAGAPVNRISGTPIGSIHPGATEARLRIFALGPAEVYVGPRRLRPRDWGYALPRELLLYLLLEGPRTKDQIGLVFWPEVTRDQLRGRFRTALYQLRQALGGTEWVRYQGGRYGFNRDLDYWLDVEAFGSDLDAAGERPDATGPLQRAVELYRGDLLEGDAPGRWASPHRDRLRRRYIEALMKLAELRSDRGSVDSAIELYRRVIDCDELHEEAHRALARSRARAGDRAGALRHLDTLASTLQRELDMEPSAETLELRSTLEQGLDV